MAYWLFKSEPGTYSLSDLQREKCTTWDGITNNAALKNLRSVQKGDLVFIYHSGDDKCLMGLAEVTRAAYPDPKLDDPKMVVVDIAFKMSFPKKVTLAEIKAKKEFATFDLVRISRLSVMPVGESHKELLLQMSIGA